jgi:hypothetical protein
MTSLILPGSAISPTSLRMRAVRLSKICTKQVVSYAFSDRININLTLAALDMAVCCHKPQPGLIIFPPIIVSNTLPPLTGSVWLILAFIEVYPTREIHTIIPLLGTFSAV